jgi:hypothetical protein
MGGLASARPLFFVKRERKKVKEILQSSFFFDIIDT